MSRALQRMASAGRPRLRTILQSFDTARFQRDDQADTKTDIDQARSEILSAILFGHEVVIPAGVIADCPAAHQLLPEVLAGSSTPRRWIESDTGREYAPIRLGLEEQYVRSNPQGYDAFVHDYISDQRRRLTSYVELSKVAPGVNQRELVIKLGEAYLGRRFDDVRAISRKTGDYFEFIHANFGETRRSAPRPVTCRQGTFTTAPTNLYSKMIRDCVKSLTARRIEYDPSQILSATASRVARSIVEDSGELGQRGSWYSKADAFEDHWDVVRVWLDHALYSRMNKAYGIGVPSYFLQESLGDPTTAEATLAFLDEPSIARMRQDAAAGKPTLPPAAVSVSWPKVWELVSEQDVQLQIFRFQLAISNARAAALSDARALRSRPAEERAAERHRIVGDYRSQCATYVEEHIAFLNAGQSAVVFEQRSNRLMVKVGKPFKPIAGTSADKNTGRAIGVAVGTVVDQIFNSGGWATSGLIAIGETGVGELVGGGVNYVVDKVRRPSNASARAADRFYGAETDRVNYWLSPF